MKLVVTVGGKTLNLGDVFGTPAPADEEMVTFCNTFGLMVETGVNRGVKICEIFQATAKTTTHPWLLAILFFADSKIREGHSLAAGIADGLKSLIQSRVADLAQKPGPAEWASIEPGEWAIPDFFGYFNVFLSMVEVGEETGELDTVLFHVRDFHKHNRNGIGESIWGKDVALLCTALSVLHSAGIPNTGSLRVLQHVPALASLREELGIVAGEVEAGHELSDGFAKTAGQLAHPAFVSLVASGEQRGTLGAALQRASAS